MSFTAEVKNELSRVTSASKEADLAQLSALMRVTGTLSFHGAHSYSVRIVTETGTVARTVVALSRQLFGLGTSIEYRRSIMHKKRNYLLEISNQKALGDALEKLGILTSGTGIQQGIPRQLLQTKQMRVAFMRGAFMAGGFVADPRKDFHLEIAVTGARFAQDLVVLLATTGITARLNYRNRHATQAEHTRELYAVYLKSSDDIIAFLRLIGALNMAKVVFAARQMKYVRNTVNRGVNAEVANQKRSSDAAASQLRLINRAEQLIGLDKLPPAVQRFCRVRRENPELSLAALGESLVPAVSKSAMYHRLLRLEKIVQEAEKFQ